YSEFQSSDTVLVTITSRRALSFLFQRHCDHRDLHSFPTRRSSDLLNNRRSFAASGAVGAKLIDLLGITRVSGGAELAAHMVVIRSEEHTSELQSRENLVCRLLLEKKN